MCDIFFIGTGEQFGKDIFLLFRFRIIFDRRFLFRIVEFDLCPHFFQIFLDLRRRLIGKLAVIKQIQIDEQSVSNGHIQFVTAQFPERIGKTVVAGTEQNAVVHAPALIAAVSEMVGQMLIGTFLTEKQVINVRCIIKIQKFVVNTALFRIFPCRDDPCDVAGNTDRSKIFQNADTFVAFLYIKFIHVFVSFDRFTDSFINMTLA